MKGPTFLACNPVIEDSSIVVHLFKHSYFIPAFKSSGAYVLLYESDIESLIFQRDSQTITYLRLNNCVGRIAQ